MSESSSQDPDSSLVSQMVTPNMSVARVPEKIGRGVMATGFLVYTGPQEFVVDFIQGVARPAQLVARVVLSPAVTEQFIIALRDNLNKFIGSFGAPPVMPRNSNEKPPTPQEIYDQLKIPEDMQSGQYANSVLIRHSPAEFHFDFVTNFYPHGSVSARIYLAAPRVAGLLDTLAGSLTNWQKARGITPALPQGSTFQMPMQQPPPESPPGSQPGGAGPSPDNPDQPPPSPRAYPY